jgi:hypothetical protein
MSSKTSNEGVIFSSGFKKLRTAFPALGSLIQDCANQQLPTTRLAPQEWEELSVVLATKDESIVATMQSIDYPREFISLDSGLSISIADIKSGILFSHSSEKQEKPANQETDIPDTKRVKTFAESANDLVRRRDKYVLELTENYKSELAQNRVTPKEIVALGEVIARIPDDENVWNANKGIWLKRNVRSLYAGILPYASISFPFLHLKEASERVNFSPGIPQMTWGIQDGKVILPRPESFDEDSVIWVFLRSLLLTNYSEYWKLDETFSPDKTIPSLATGDTAKNRRFETVFIRLLELTKTPESATIRSGRQLNEEELVKNMVDYYVLDKRHQQNGRLKTLSVSSDNIRSYKRAVNVSKTIGTTVRMEKAYVGYKLSELLIDGADIHTASVPENEPFVRFIFGILDKIAENVSSKYEIPRHFFTEPAVLLRREVRQGPMITRKKGDKANLYVPFSYAKSKECNRLPENIRKDMTDIGDSILKGITTINNKKVSEAADSIPVYETYLKACYSTADECRKQWRNSQRVPNTELLRSNLVVEDISSKSHVELASKVAQIQRLKLVFTPVSDDAQEVASIRSEILSIVKSREDSRRKPAVPRRR